MNVLVGFLTDKDNNKQVFDDLAAFLEKYNYNDNPLSADGITILMQIERRIQDMEDAINYNQENVNKDFSTAVFISQTILESWRNLLKNAINKEIYLCFIDSLSKLTNTLHAIIYEGIAFPQIQNIFRSIIDDKDLPPNFVLRNYINPETKAKLEILLPPFHSAVSDNGIPAYVETDPGTTPVDPDNVIYYWKVDLWINTTDAFKANKFMHHLSSIFHYIDDIEIELTEARVGSYFQEWTIKIKGFFAKKRTKEILSRGIKAAEYYGLERHIEPIEKNKAERIQIEEANKRLMSEDQTKTLHDLTIEEKKEDVKTKKLANIEKEIALGLKISDLLAKGLIEFDDEYRIMINGILLLEHKDKTFKLGNVDQIDENETKSS
jgi:hypothetical protein